MSAKLYAPGGECRRGHPLVGDNLRKVWERGPKAFRWRCRKCIAISLAKRREQFGRWEAKNPGAAKRSNTKTKLKKYGITPEDFGRMVREQDGKCPICQQKLGGPSRGARHPVVDHCHESGLVRGILCNKCNRGLGLFGDDRERLQAALDYLQHPATPVHKVSR
jgi:hypothetical protein